MSFKSYRLNPKRAQKESDLEKGVAFLMRNGISDIMVYGGLTKEGKHVFMHEYGKGPILSWEKEGKLLFEDSRIILGNAEGFEIYEDGTEEYEKNLPIIKRAMKEIKVEEKEIGLNCMAMSKEEAAQLRYAVSKKVNGQE